MSYLLFAAILSYRKRNGHGLLDLESLEGAGQQSCHNWPEIPTDVKQSKQDTCFAENNLSSATSQVIFIAHLPVDVIQYCLLTVCHRGMNLCKQF
jgi:hypothetical protein